MGKKLALWRDHGRDENGRVVAWGTNARLDNLQAAFLNFKLQTYQKDMDRRRQIAGMYQDGLGDIKEMDLPQGPNANPDHFDIYQNYELAADRRDDLKAYLKDQGIGTIIQWAGTPVHQFTELGFAGKGKSDLPATDRFFERCLMLPMNMALSDDDVNYIISKIRAFYGYSA